MHHNTRPQGTACRVTQVEAQLSPPLPAPLCLHYASTDGERCGQAALAYMNEGLG